MSRLSVMRGIGNFLLPGQVRRTRPCRHGIWCRIATARAATATAAATAPAATAREVGCMRRVGSMGRMRGVRRVAAQAGVALASCWEGKQLRGERALAGPGASAVIDHRGRGRGCWRGRCSRRQCHQCNAHGYKKSSLHWNTIPRASFPESERSRPLGRSVRRSEMAY